MTITNTKGLAKRRRPWRITQALGSRLETQYQLTPLISGPVTSQSRPRARWDQKFLIKASKRRLMSSLKAMRRWISQRHPATFTSQVSCPHQTLGLDDVLPADFSIKRREPKQIVQMKGTVGLFGTCFTMLKVFLGIGILATPRTFEDVGILGGIFGLILIGIMNTYTMHL